jgi:membrane associated rhomboid family serine protease
MYRLTKAVKWLLIANTVTFLLGLTLEKFANIPFTSYFGLVPYLVIKKGFIWQFVTYMFFHASMFHFMFNMLILAMVGIELENTWVQNFSNIFICGVGLLSI